VNGTSVPVTVITRFASGTSLAAVSGVTTTSSCPSTSVPLKRKAPPSAKTSSTFSEIVISWPSKVAGSVRTSSIETRSSVASGALSSAVAAGLVAASLALGAAEDGMSWLAAGMPASSSVAPPPVPWPAHAARMRGRAGRMPSARRIRFMEIVTFRWDCSRADVCIRSQHRRHDSCRGGRLGRIAGKR
jgi:hypothetical protein